MRKSRLSLVKQARLIEHFVAGTTARCAADLIGVNRNTAAYYLQRLREIIVDELEHESYKTLMVRLKWMRVILEEHAKGVEVGVLQEKCLYLA